MTHSMHRQGTYDNLSDDFVLLGVAGGAFEDLPATFRQFDAIAIRHQPVEVPATQLTSAHHFVYDAKEKIRSLLTDLAVAELGISVTISGLRDQVTECCRAAELNPHTVCQSLGFWGKTERLPHFRALEVSTMCGHGRVSPNLVWDLAKEVQRQALDSNEASKRMNELCRCQIFNSARAAKLTAKLAADIEAGIVSFPQSHTKADITPNKDFGITIDEAKCIGCMDCLPYCPVSAIIESSTNGIVSIDAERCTECGVCLQSEVCPVEAIVGEGLTWPRTLRGKFHSLHSPYRAAPTLAQTTKLSTDNQIFASKQISTELTSDVTGCYNHGEVEIKVELGRPHLGITFRDVQKVIQALIPVGLNLEHQYPPLDGRSPLTDLTIDVNKGILRPEILDQKTGWVPLKLEVPEDKVLEALKNLRQVTTEIDTIFAVDIISLAAKDGSSAADRLADKIGTEPACNCKTNVGLGRPLAVLQ